MNPVYRAKLPDETHSPARTISCRHPARYRGAHGDRKDALAVTSPTRNPALPATPSFAELGLPQVAVKAWHGIIALKGTPREATDRLGKELAAVLADPALQRRMIEGQSEPAKGDSASFANLVEIELTRWADVIKQSGITLEK